jgi:hypothetical protein
MLRIDSAETLFSALLTMLMNASLVSSSFLFSSISFTKWLFAADQTCSIELKPQE